MGGLWTRLFALLSVCKKPQMSRKQAVIAVTPAVKGEYWGEDCYKHRRYCPLHRVPMASLPSYAARCGKWYRGRASGCEGHRIVADIAQERLAEVAKRNVQSVIVPRLRECLGWSRG